MGSIVSVCVGLLGSTVANADLDVVETLDPQTLIDTIVNPTGTGITINNVTVFGVAGQIGTFTNGLSVPGFVTYEEGIILSSGEITSIAGPNAGDGTSQNIAAIAGADGDPDFDSLTTAPQGTFDAAYVEITFTPTEDMIRGTFTFASEEYNEYAPPAGVNSAGNTYYDVMAFFVNGVNQSLTASGDNVSINTVNETLNAADFITNDRTDGVPTPVNIEPDGFTRKLTWTASVTPGVENTLKFGVADGGDATFNSWLLVDKYAFRILPAPANVDLSLTKTDNTAAVAVGTPLTYEFTVTNGGATQTGREITVTDTLPAGVTVNNGQAAAMDELGPDGSEWTCQSNALTPQEVVCRSVLEIYTGAGNSSSTFGFVTDPISAALDGNTLVNTAVISTTDIDTDSSNDNASDSTLVTTTDVTGSTVTLSGAPAIIDNTNPYTVLIDFNEPVVGFDITDLVVANATASTLVDLGDNNYSVDITPDGVGDVTVSLPASSVQDAAGNNSDASNVETTVFNANAVELVITDTPDFVANTDPYSLTMTFSEPVIGFNASDIQVTNGAPSNLLEISPGVYTVDITPDGSGDIAVFVPAAAATDTAGLDDSIEASASTVYNISAPVVDILGAPAAVSDTASYPITFEFSENVTGFDATDINVANGLLSNFVAVDGNTYTADITPAGTGDILVNVPIDVAVDVAGNGNQASMTATTVFDDQGPVLSLLGLPATANTTANIPLTFEFDEDVVGFSVADVGVTNGSLLNFTAVDGNTYTADLTPNGAGDVDVDVAVGVAQDALGNDNSATTGTMIYDDEAPVITISTVAFDNVINASEDDTDVVVSGTVTGLESGQDINVNINGVDYVTTPSAGNWSITVPAAAAQALDTTEDITATATDVAGNASTPVVLSIVHDTTPPAVPVVTSLLTNNNAPTLSGTASLAPGDVLTVEVDSVTYTAGDSYLTDNGDGSWDLVIPGGNALAEGDYSVNAVITDSAGNVTGDTTATELSIDTTAPLTPLIAVDLAATDDSGSSDTDNITNDATAGFSVPAGTVTAGEQVTLLANGVNVGTTTVAGDGSFVVATDPLVDADYDMTYAVTDAAGNTSAESPILSVTVDTVVLAPVVDSPIAGDDVINSAESDAVLVSGVAEPDSTVVVSFDDGVVTPLLVSVTTDASGNWTLLGSEADVSSLNDGAIIVLASVTDVAGNTNASAGTSITLDTTAPDAPTVDSLLTNNTTPTVTGAATTAAGDVISVMLNGVTYLSTDSDLADNGDGTWALIVPAGDVLAEAIYDIAVTVTDSNGNASADGSTNELEVDTTPPSTPTVVSQVTNTSTPVLTGNAVVLPSDILSVDVDSVVYTAGDGNLIDNADGTWTLSVPLANALSDGPYNVIATITDAAGNTSADSTSGELFIDTVSPVAPAVVAQVTNIDSPVITGTATIGAGEVLTVELNSVVYTAGGGALVDNGDGTWALTVPTANALTDGVYDVMAVVTDSAGNATSEAAAGELTIDTTAPVAPTIAPNLIDADDSGIASTDNITNVAAATFDVPAATATAGQVVEVFANGVSVVTTTVLADGSFTIASSALVDGNHAITYTLTDNADNTSAISPTLNITIDTATSAPVIATPIEIDGIANATEHSDVLITGTAEANSNITLTLSDGVNADIQVIVATAGDGSWTLSGSEADVSGFVDGTITVDAIAGDVAGNVASAIQVSFEHVTTVPTVAINAVSTDNIINATEDDSPITVSGTTTDIEDGQIVSASLNGVSYVATVGANTWSFDISVAQAQALGTTTTLIADVSSAAGNLAVQATQSVTHDTTIPELTISPISTDNIINAVEDDSDITISGTTIGIEDGQSVTISLNGQSYSGVVNSNAWAVTLPAADATALPLNDVVSANVTDAAGNPAITVTQAVVHDTAAPIVTITSAPAATGANSSAYVVAGTCTTGDDDVSVTITGATPATLSVLCNASGDWTASFDVSAIADGINAIVVNAQQDDIAGNTGTAATFQADKNTSVPSISIDVVASDDYINDIEDNADVIVTGTTTSVEDGQVVTVEVDGATFTSTVTAGAWSVTISQGVVSSLGFNETILASVANVVGTDAEVATRAIIHDVTPPATPAVTAMLTNQSEPVISGTATLAPGDVLEVTINSKTYVAGDGNLVDNGDGTWTLTVPPGNALGDGNYDVTVVVTDVAGNSATESTSGELDVDTTSPAAGAIAPNLVAADDTGASDIDDITNIVAVNFNVPASTATAGDTVSVFADGVVVGTGTVDSDGSFIVATTLPGDDVYAITYVLTDPAGNDSTVSPALVVTVDTAIAAPVIYTPIELDDVINQSEHSDVLAEGSAEAFSIVEISFDDGTNMPVLVTVTADADGEWTLNGIDADLSALDQGAINVDAGSTDAAGNLATAATETITHDSIANVAPTVTTLITNIAAPTITGTATITVGDTLIVLVNGITYTEGAGELVDNGDGTWALTLPIDDALSDGTYDVLATSTDAAGNISTDGTTNELIVDTVSPAEPAVTAQLTSNDTPVIVGTAIVEPGDVLTVELNGVTYTAGDGALVDNTDGTWALTVPLANALTDGVYDVVAVVTDPAGNTASEVNSGELTIDSTAPTTPIVLPNLANASDSGTSATDDITNILTPTFDVPAGTATAGQGVEVFANGVSVGTTTVASDGSFSLPSSSLIDGGYAITYTLTDAAGNTSAASPVLNVTIDSTVSVPVIDTPIEIDGIANSTEHTDVLVTGSAEANSEVLITLSDGVAADIQVTVTSIADGSWTLAGNEVDISGFVDGMILVDATATDIAGNVAVATTETFEHTTTTPAIFISAVSTDNIINAAEDDVAITVSGTTTDIEDGQIVSATLNGRTYSATVNANAWSFDLPAADAQVLGATTTLTADVSSDAGNDAVQATQTIVHDTTIPELTINPVATDNIINASEDDVDITVTGTSVGIEDGQNVSVILNAQSYSGTVNSGVWSVTIPAVDAQALPVDDALSVDATDVAGNAATTVVQPILHDTTASIVAITTAPIATGANSGTYVVGGTCTVSDGDVNVSIVGATPASQTALCNGAGDWTASFDVSAITDGANAIVVDATQADAAGNTGAATTVQADKNTSVPSISINVVASDDYINSVEDDADVVIGGITTSVEDGQIASIVLNGKTYTTTVASNAWSVSVPQTDVTSLDATETITANVTNSAGTAAEEATRDIIYDTTAPAEPAVTALLTNQTEPVISGTATLAPGDILEVTVNLITYTEGDGNLIDNGDGTWTLTIPADDALVEGTYDVTVVVTDVAGNSVSESTSAELEIDTSAPATGAIPPNLAAASDSGASDADEITNVLAAVFNVPAATGASGDTVVLYANGVEVGSGTVLVDGSFSITSALPGDGTYTITYAFTDEAGNNGAASPGLLVTVDSYVNAPQIDTPIETDDIVNASENTDVLVTGAADAQSSVDVIFDDGTNPPVVVTVVANADGEWSLSGNEADLSNLAEGPITVEAQSTDIAGNTAAAVSKSVTHDSIPPSVPTVIAQETNSTTPTITGTAVLSTGDTLVILLNGVSYTAGAGALVDNGDGTWELNVPLGDELVDATYDVLVTTKDSAGNISSDATNGELTIDTVAPAAPAVSTQVTSNTAPVISGSATVSPGDVLTVELNGTVYTVGDGALVDNGDGTWVLTVPPANALTDGVYDVMAIVTDSAGNATPELGAAELTIDTIAPATPSVAPNLVDADDSGLSSTDNATRIAALTYDVPAGTAVSGQIVELLVDGVSAGSATVIADGSFTVVAPAQADGLYAITYTLTDEVGNTSASSPALNVTIDSTTSVPVITSPIENDGIANVSEHSDVLISGTAEAGSIITVTLSDGVNPGIDVSVTTSGDGSWSLLGNEVDISGFNDGAIVVDAEAADVAGNTASAVQATFEHVTTVPTILISAVSTDNIINAVEDDSDITVVGTSSDIENGQTVSAMLNGKAYSAVVTSNSWSFLLPAADAQVLGATSILTVDAANVAGNSATQATQTVTHDTTIPELTIDPVSTDNIISATEDDSDIVITGASTGIEDGQSVSVGLGGKTYSAIVNSGLWLVTLPASDAQALAANDSVLVDATDIAGNEALTLNLPIVHDTVLPVVDITSAPIATGANSALYGVGGTCTVGDNDVIVSVAGATPATQSVLCDGSGEWSASFDVSAVADGANTIVIDAQQSDAAGNSGSAATTQAEKNTTVPSISISVVAADDYINDTEDNASVVVAGTTSSVEDGQVATIMINGNTFSSTVTSNAWTVTIPQANVEALDFNETITADVSNFAGTSAEQASRDIIHDTAPPSTPAVTALLTNQTEPVITGTATLTPGDVLEVTVNSQTYTAGDGDLVDNGDGTWTLTIPAEDTLAEGTYDVTVVVTDVAGNSASETTSEELEVDTSAPGAGTLAPNLIAADDSGSSDTDNTTNVLAATFDVPAATAPAGHTAIIYADGVEIGSGVVAEDGSFSIATALPGDGEHSMTYTLTDPAGNLSTASPALTVVVDTTGNPPVIDTPIEIDDVINSAEHADVLVTGTAEALSSLDVSFDDGVNLPVVITVVADAGGIWTLLGNEADLSGLEEGVISVDAESIDIAGNVAAALTATITHDSLLANAPTVDTQLTNSTVPTITGTATLSVGDTLSVRVNGVTYTAGAGALVDIGDGTWELNIPSGDALTDAIYAVEASVTDMAGNTVVDASANELTIDTVAPDVPTVVSQVTNNPTPTLTGNVSLFPGDFLTVVVNGVPYQIADGLVVPGDGTWTLEIPVFNSIDEGIYSVFAVVEDAASNFAMDATDNELIVDNTAPAAPTVDTLSSNTSTPTITGTAVLFSGDVLSVTVDGKTYTDGDGSLTSSGDGTWNLVIDAGNALADGDYEVVATTTDAASNARSDTSSLELNVDSIAPAIPSVTALITNSGTPTITGTAVLEAGDTLVVTVGGVDYPLTGSDLTANGDGTWTLIVPVEDALSEADYDVTVAVTDVGGNTSIDGTTAELTVDTTAPAVPTTTELVTNNETPTLVGTASLDAGDTLVVVVNGVTYSISTDLSITGNDWSLTIPAGSELIDGNYDVIASVTDQAGNVALDGSVNELTIDTIAPTISLAAVAGDNIISAVEDDSDVIINGTTTGVEDNRQVTVTVDVFTYTATVMANTWSVTMPAANAQSLPVTSTVTATVSDLAGNAAAPGSVSVTHDTVLPVTTIDSPPQITAANASAYSITGMCSVGDGDVTVATSQGTPASQTVACSATGEWTAELDMSAIADGSAVATMTANQTDAAGNSSEIATATPDKDATVPVISISSNGSEGDDFYNVAESTGVAIYGATEGVDDGTVVEITFTDGDAMTLTATATVTAGDWNTDPIDLTSLSDGPITINANVSDAVGNDALPATDSATLFAVLPVITAVDYGPGIDATPDLSGSTDLADGTTVSITDVDNEFICAAIVAASSWSCESTVTFSEGASSLTATGTDAAGNVASDAFTVTIDTSVDTDADGISDAIEGTVDSDGDGTQDYLDTDSDNDGINDADEGVLDSDGDGIANYIDTDSDNDGLDDSVEQAIDTDGDGRLNYVDLDSDNDGIPDAIELDDDFDADGIVNYLDLDSDNDGIADVVEAGGEQGDVTGVIADFTDNNGDGQHDDTVALPLADPDTDLDGNLDRLSLDADGDGIFDVLEAGGLDADADGIIDDFVDANLDGLSDVLDLTPLVDADTDADNVVDRVDTDSDGDGIDDATESAGTGGLIDTDSDGVPNHLDLDSDGDTLLDADEGIADLDADGIEDYVDNNALTDTDGDGINDSDEGTDDADGDSIPNFEDTDSDGDGIDDSVEGNVDFDGDGIPNFLDTDSDNDDISDELETSDDDDSDGAGNYLDTDSDDDGISDTAEAGSDPTSPLDSDGDGVADYLDTDSDNDGIDDLNEGGGDTDGDGIPDYLDEDSDDDGILDSVAGNGDFDEDGTPNYLDDDIDDDGILNAVEGASDNDGDGIPNYLDSDSDGDGIPDVTEGDIDTDADGIPDFIDTDSDADAISDADEAGGGTGGQDSDGDTVPDHLDPDSDNDGISDLVETNQDTDGDGTPNYLDLDSDGDTVPDSVEGALDADADGTPNFVDLDSDADGILDSDEVGADPANPIDTDGDGVLDYLDTDSDNDGIADSIEGTADTDGDSVPDYLDTDSDDDGISDGIEGEADTDGDGVRDFRDTDSDGDGIDDLTEGVDDTDNDGVADFQDLDADGDGIPDVTETQNDSDEDGIPDYLDADSDDDGIEDGLEGSSDVDGDGVPNYLDRDSDGDGVPDSVEGSDDADNDGLPNSQDVDSDDDGIGDAAEVGLNPDTPIDSDGDGVPDYIDGDSDNDGIADSIEGLSDTDGDGVEDFLDTDSDNDGISDGQELGPDPLNPADTDEDGIPDFRDLDADGDGIADELEGTVDTDGDGEPDYLDQDADGDGIADAIEQNVDTDGDGAPDYIDNDSDGDGITDDAEVGTNPSEPTDTDGDGTPDYLDTDSDNDGLPDSEEGPTVVDSDNDGIPDDLDTDANGDGILDEIVPEGDLDNDGIPNDLDADIDGDGIANTAEGDKDTDGDGIPDFIDEDSDNDGISDAIEGNGDLDGDGIADYIDSDSDGDGIPDLIETDNDSDADGIPDYLDSDSDNDNIPDSIEGGTGVIDTDEDGTPDYLDSDSDGDGISDQIEGNVDTDGDGIIDAQDIDSDDDGIEDSVESTQDSDGDSIPDYLDIDSDNDTIPDAFEGIGDSDNDGVPDYIDGDVDTTQDSDGDGIPDLVEGAGDIDGDGLANLIDTDSDGDGIPDSVEGEKDTDGDSIPDFIDTDSDGDGLSDLQEGADDHDGDGVIDSLDLDSDNDGIPDVVETHADSDSDGVPNSRDRDSDNDGLSDYFELTGNDLDNDGVVDAFVDNNNDGLHDAQGNLPTAPDTDKDLVPDMYDIDSDNDGITDAIEAGFIDANRDGRIDAFVDTNNNGFADNVEQAPLRIIDTDSDGIPDFRDTDSDQDGLPDLVEARGNGSDHDGYVDFFVDSNMDGLDDSLLILPFELIDSDGDSIPDYLEIDSDNDGISDLAETGGVDVDNDGVVDVMADTDKDGIVDVVDVDFTFGADSDNDGIDDSADVDFVFNALDTDFDGIIDSRDPDADGNGFADSPGNAVQLGAALPDTDGNDVPDYQQALQVGSINSGLSGSGLGCSIASANDKQVIDPMRALLMLVAVMYLIRRRIQVRPA